MGSAYFVPIMRALFTVLTTTGLLLLANACSIDRADDDVDVDESMLSECTLAVASECEAIQLLRAREDTETARAPRVTRADVTVRAAAPNEGAVAKQFRRQTSRALRYRGGKVTLSGDALATQPLVLDDFLLVEVLDLSGRTTAAGVASKNEVQLGGVTVAPLSAPVPWDRGAHGYVHDPGALDITSLLPRDQPFRLRVSAFDFIGDAKVTDVFLRIVPDASPLDPFADDYCSGPVLTRDVAVAHIAPGAASVRLGALSAAVRARTCNPVSGCGPWENDDRFIFPRFEFSDYRGVISRDHTMLMPAVAGSGVTLSIEPGRASNELGDYTDVNRVFATVNVTTSDASVVRRLNLSTDYPTMGGPAEIWTTRPCSGTCESWAPLTGEVGLFGVIGEHCTRLVGSRTTDGRQRQIVLYGRY